MRSRAQRRQRYRRAIWAGLTASLVFHGLLFALARFSGEPLFVDSELELAALVAVEDRAEEPESSPATAGEAGPGELTELASPAMLSSVVALNEVAFVLARAAALQVAEPIVPRPALQPRTVDGGFTPIVVEQETRAASIALARGSGSGARNGGGISIGFGGHYRCPPGQASVLIDRRLPVAGTFQRTGL